MPKTATAVFAAGCFWATEAAFDQIKGVVHVTSGYSGGNKQTANYETVCTGNTGHAESIEVTYDPSRVSYEQLLDVFFAAHDPTSSIGKETTSARNTALQFSTPATHSDEPRWRKFKRSIEPMRSRSRSSLQSSR